jgi:predicted RNA-binding protein associated with RNAse of E/G family
MREPITVIKNDHEGNEVWRYEGVVTERRGNGLVIEAPFNVGERDLGYVVFRRGDRFVEYHYTDRWYNISEVHAVEDDALKGWYCNFQRPAITGDGVIEADDLALDMFVYPDGEMLVLDADEFGALEIGEAERAAVLVALSKLQTMVKAGDPPFNRR